MAKAESTSSNKRRLRAPAPTVRQKAEKAQAIADRPVKTRRVRVAASGASQPLRRMGKVFHRQPFRFIGHLLWPRFMRNAFAELRLVSWPDRKQTFSLTFAVLAFAVVFGAGIAVVDYGLDKLFRAILLK